MTKNQENEAEKIIRIMQKSNGTISFNVYVQSYRGAEDLKLIYSFLHELGIVEPVTNVLNEVRLTAKKGWNFVSFDDERLKEEIQKDKEDIDFKLKRISYDSVKVNKWLPLYAIGIAIISAGMPVLMYLVSKNDVQKTETHIPQLQQLQQLQERMLQTQQQMKDCLYKLENTISRVVDTAKKH